MKIFSTIQGKIMFYLSTSIALVIFGLAVYIYISESKKRINEVEKSVVEVMKARNDQFTAVINGYIEQAKLYSEKPEIYQLNKNTLPETLNEVRLGYSVRSVDIVHKDGTLTNPGKHSIVDLTDRAYYKDIFEKKRERSIFTIKSEHTGGDKIMGIVIPLQNKKKEVIAGMILSFDLDKLSEMILSDMRLLGGETFIIDETQKVILHSNKDEILTRNFNDDTESIAGMSGLIEKLNKEKMGSHQIVDSKGVEYKVFFNSIENTGGWCIGFMIPFSSIEAPVISMLTKLLLGFVLAVLVCLLVIWLISSKLIVAPLKNVMNVTQKLSEGDLDLKIESKQNDEIGQMTRAISSMLVKLNEIVISIINVTKNITTSSQELSGASQQLAKGASEQASSIEEVSATMEQITSNINQSTDNANQTARVSEEANKGIVKVSERSDEAVEANKSIAEKIMVINSIADRTNLLAINASIEAARAGEHGKGFAVVASEVRKLAENSQNAAEDIVKLAESSLKTSEMAGMVMSETIPKIENAFQLVQEIAAAGNEQRTGIDQVNNAIQQLNNITQQNAASSEQLASSAVEMSSQAKMLKGLIAFFKVNEDGLGVNPEPSSIKKKNVFKGFQNIDNEKKNDIITLPDEYNEKNDFENF